MGEELHPEEVAVDLHLKVAAAEGSYLRVEVVEGPSREAEVAVRLRTKA